MKKYLVVICFLLLVSCTEHQESLAEKMSSISVLLDLINQEIQLERASNRNGGSVQSHWGITVEFKQFVG